MKTKLTKINLAIIGISTHKENIMKKKNKSKETKYGKASRDLFLLRVLGILQLMIILKILESIERIFGVIIPFWQLF